MITFKNFRIEKGKDSSRLCADMIEFNNIVKIWYEVDKDKEKYLCIERADAFVTAFLLYSMEKGEDIVVVDNKISEKLYYNINNYIIPAIVKNSKKYKTIRIIGETISDLLQNYGHNGTGISGGVDSFYTVKSYYENVPKSLKLDVLTLFNVGSNGDLGGEKSFKLFNKRIQEAKKIVDMTDCEFITVNSNISDYLNQVFVESHTFRSMSAVFAIQKAFKNYYYSSGYSLNQFKIDDKVPAKGEIFYLHMLTNENISFYSSGCNVSRLEKTEFISDFELANKNLNVCLIKENNCCKCEKCIRTMFELYANKNLDSFKDVFDLDGFVQNKNWYEQKFIEYYFYKKGDYIDTYRRLKQNKISIKLSNKVIGFLLFIKHYYFINLVKKILPDSIKNRIKEWRNNNVK